MAENKIQILQKVYDTQHYFIDRHDGMAEKMMNALVIITTLISAIAAIKINSYGDFLIVILVSCGVHLSLFGITLILLLRTIRPLSSKAIKYADQTLVGKHHKKQINKSTIYYRGIVSIIEKALEEENSPSEIYTQKLDMHEKDIIQQIFILAQYNQYKRKCMERATLFMQLTIGSGIIVFFFILISSSLAS